MYFDLPDLNSCLGGKNLLHCLPAMLMVASHLHMKGVPACNSFAGHTMILMADGTSKRIDKVKVGDKIKNALPGAPPGSQDQTHTVTAIHITHTDRAYTDVTIATRDGTRTVSGTSHHLYWNATAQTWTRADHLHVDDHLQTASARTTTVLALRTYSATMITYNLTIEGLHAYYVEAGATPVLVHNGGTCEGIALGLSETDGNPMALHDFADSVGAKSYHDWPSGGDNWVAEFQDYVKDGGTRIQFNLDGIENPVEAARTGRGLDPIFDGHATAWELSFIQDNPSSWSRVTFYRNGNVVANPFAR